MNKPLVSYAQNYEDMILEVLLRDTQKGFYVDVGANHAVLHSVTKHFYDKGWTGINIEPNTLLYKELKKARRRDVNLNVGVSEKAGKLMFRQYPHHDGFSTFSKEVIALREKQGSPYEDIVVPVLPLKKIFAYSKVKHIDFMKVDVEGYEYEVLKSNDWDKYQPKVLVVEGISKNWPQLLRNHGYKRVFFDGLNQYYVHGSAPECDINNYSEVLLSFGYISYGEHLLRGENAKLNSDYKELLAKVNSILGNPSEHIGLRRLIISSIQRLLKTITGKLRRG